MSQLAQQHSSIRRLRQNFLFTNSSKNLPATNGVRPIGSKPTDVKFAFQDGANSKKFSLPFELDWKDVNVSQSHKLNSASQTDQMKQIQLQLRDKVFKVSATEQSMSAKQPNVGGSIRQIGQQIGQQSKSSNIAQSFVSCVRGAPRVPAVAMSLKSQAAERRAPAGVKMTMQTGQQDGAEDFSIDNVSGMDIKASHFDDQMLNKQVQSRRASPKMSAAVLEKTAQKVYKVKLHTIDGERDIDCPEDKAVFFAAEESPNIAHWEMPRLCRHGDCGACAGKLIKGTVDQSKAVGLSEEEKKRGYVLTCVAKPTSDDVEIECEKFKQLHRERNPDYRFPFQYSKHERLHDLSSSGTRTYPLHYHWP